MTDKEIVAIRDDHLPNQGESFDCIAFARAIEAAAISAEREACARVCDKVEKDFHDAKLITGANVIAIQAVEHCVAAIRED